MKEIIFHPITLADQEWVRQKLREDDFRSCELSFANNYIWRHVYDVAVAEVLSCGIIRYVESGEYKYSFPFGSGDKKQVIALLREHCAAMGKTLCMYPIEEEACRQLKEWFPGMFLITGFRGDYDYIYTTEKLSALKGSKLHGKRNHIARFKDDPDWNYEPLSHENMEECRRMSRTWTAMREEKWNDEMEEEIAVLHEAMDVFDELGLVGGVLRRHGEVVAFTLGEPLNSDTFVVHFEKAFPALQGAYPMINQQFVLHECQNFTYVNREEDTGDMGLRKAKLSYYPDILHKKYNASESHVVYAAEEDAHHIREIWKECFGDGDDYINLYLKGRFEPENMLVIHMDGKPVSMASFLPVTVTVHGEKKPARYVYAVATLPDYRDRGYAAEILRFAAEYYKEPLILQPAEEELVDYYAKLGFVKAFEGGAAAAEGETTSALEKMESQAECSAERDVQGEWQFKTITAAGYKRIRDRRFGQEGYVEWDESAIGYALEENAFCGGTAVMLTKKHSESVGDSREADRQEENLYEENLQEEILLCRVEDERLILIETTLSERELQKLIPLLLDENGASGVERVPVGGMILCPEQAGIEANFWRPEVGYLGLTLG